MSMTTLRKYEDALEDVIKAFDLMEYQQRKAFTPALDNLLWAITSDLYELKKRLEEEIEVEEEDIREAELEDYDYED